MDVFPKFIIETDSELGDCLIIAKCTYHKQLATNTNMVKGGGWWRLNKETNTFTLFGDSTDFGKSTINDILKCIQSGNVYTDNLLIDSISNDYNFKYDIGSEIIDLPK